MSQDLCAACHDSLLVEIEPDSSEGEDDNDEVMQATSTNGSSDKVPATSNTSTSVLDDVELNCGCHFHWECFLDSSTITSCPSCDRNISTLSPPSPTSPEPYQQVLVTVRNEGGVQRDYDILPSATEEAYLRAYPEERKAHAFLEFVREGDLDAVVHLLREDRDRSGLEEGEEEGEEARNGDGRDEEEEELDIDVLKYTGTFEGIEGSALHVAIRYAREDVAWLLLALASQLPWGEFPQGAVGVLEGLGLGTKDRRADLDVRTIKDGEGRLPVDLARHVGGVWKTWVESGRLNP